MTKKTILILAIALAVFLPVYAEGGSKLALTSLGLGGSAIMPLGPFAELTDYGVGGHIGFDGSVPMNSRRQITVLTVQETISMSSVLLILPLVLIKKRP